MPPTIEWIRRTGILHQWSLEFSQVFDVICTQEKIDKWAQLNHAASAKVWAPGFKSGVRRHSGNNGVFPTADSRGGSTTKASNVREGGWGGWTIVFTDPFLRFDHRFLARRQSRLSLRIEEQVQEEIKRHLLDYLGTYTWEVLCQEQLQRTRCHNRLPFLPDQVGSAWTRKAQVIVVGTNYMVEALILLERYDPVFDRIYDRLSPAGNLGL